jgi:hypothetical protein
MAALTFYAKMNRLMGTSSSWCTVTAKGADPDTLVASAKAYLGALNRLMVKRLRTKPQPMPPDAPDMADIRRVERGP